MFFVTEITHRFQTARPEIRSLLLQCLLPWLENMELVAANVTPATPLSYIMVHIQLYLQHFTENQIAYFFFFYHCNVTLLVLSGFEFTLQKRRIWINRSHRNDFE